MWPKIFFLLVFIVFFGTLNLLCSGRRADHMPSSAQHVVCIPFSWQSKSLSSFQTDRTSDERNRNKAVEGYATD